MMDIHQFYARISPPLRRARMERLARELALSTTTRILDVGGTPPIWKLCPVQPDVTFLNIDRVPGVPEDRMICHDACDLPFPDQSFDVVFSNSLIEHLETWERQQKFTAEAQRVGRRVWIQTPDPRFPIEIHLLAPFVHWLPTRWQLDAARYLSIRRWVDHSEPPEIILSSLRLIPRRELEELFPQGKIVTERFAGIPKSLIAVV
jgi:hypothetical protein